MDSNAQNTISIAIAQVNPTVGDIDANCAKIKEVSARAGSAGADLVVFPELVVCGYPPEDLVTKPAFISKCMDALRDLVHSTQSGPALIVGTPLEHGDKPFNAAVLLDAGEIRAVTHKRHLPNYGVFDEQRVFTAGALPDVMEYGSLKLGVLICEDFWTPEVPAHLAAHGAQLLIALNASPFAIGKWQERADQARARAVETALPMIYVNQVGGQDELVFDGSSFVIDSQGEQIARLTSFTEHTETTKWHFAGIEPALCETQTPQPKPSDLEAIYQAMVLGLRDYVDKNRFPGVVIGMSGGIDSALTAAVAVDALGAQRVKCMMMPSPYTSTESLEDAQACATALGIMCSVVSIEPMMQAYDQALASEFANMLADVTEENLQSRIRGTLLMAVSNKFRSMVLTTGNKSEMAVGYATLYGDMCGGYSVLKDVYKMTVFELSTWRNEHVPAGAKSLAHAVIPQRIIDKPPSAELKPEQQDTDSLPPYDTLDAILHCLIEDDLSAKETIARGFDAETVTRVARLVAMAEYKRRQAPPGVKITRRAFSRERRYPITSGFGLG